MAVSKSVHADQGADIYCALNLDILPEPFKVTSPIGLQQGCQGSTDLPGYSANGNADGMAAATVPPEGTIFSALLSTKTLEEQGHHTNMRRGVIERLSWKALHSGEHVEFILPPIKKVHSQFQPLGQLFGRISASRHALLGLVSKGGHHGLRCCLCGHARISLKLDRRLVKALEQVDTAGGLFGNDEVLAEEKNDDVLLFGNHTEEVESIGARAASMGAASLAQGSCGAAKIAKQHSLKKKAAASIAASAEVRATSVMQQAHAGTGADPLAAVPGLPLGA